MKRIICLLCTLCLILPLFSSCADKGEAVFTYQGYEITENQYRYFLSTIKTNILSHYGESDSDAFWDTEIADGVNAEDYYTEVIDGIVKNYCLTQALFRQYALTLSSDTKKAIEDDINEKIEYSGSRGELNAELADLGINISILKEIYTIEEKYNAVYEYLFGTDGVLAATDSEVEEYYENNYFLMQYIVLYTTELVTDENGNYVYDSAGTLKTQELSEEDLQAKKDLAQQIQSESNGQNASVFETWMEKSEYDTSEYPNGFYVSSNEIETFGTDVYAALLQMEPGEVRVIEEEECIYIIREYELTEYSSLTETDIEQLASLQSYASAEIASEQFDELQKEVEVNEEVKSAYSLRAIEASKYYNY